MPKRSSSLKLSTKSFSRRNHSSNHVSPPLVTSAAPFPSPLQNHAGMPMSGCPSSAVPPFSSPPSPYSLPASSTFSFLTESPSLPYPFTSASSSDSSSLSLPTLYSSSAASDTLPPPRSQKPPPPLTPQAAAAQQDALYEYVKGLQEAIKGGDADVAERVLQELGDSAHSSPAVALIVSANGARLIASAVRQFRWLGLSKPARAPKGARSGASRAAAAALSKPADGDAAKAESVCQQVGAAGDGDALRQQQQQQQEEERKEGGRDRDRDRDRLDSSTQASSATLGGAFPASTAPNESRRKRQRTSGELEEEEDALEVTAFSARECARLHYHSKLTPDSERLFQVPTDGSSLRAPALRDRSAADGLRSRGRLTAKFVGSRRFLVSKTPSHGNGNGPNATDTAAGLQREVGQPCKPAASACNSGGEHNKEGGQASLVRNGCVDEQQSLGACTADGPASAAVAVPPSSEATGFESRFQTVGPCPSSPGLLHKVPDALQRLNTAADEHNSTCACGKAAGAPPLPSLARSLDSDGSCKASRSREDTVQSPVNVPPLAACKNTQPVRVQGQGGDQGAGTPCALTGADRACLSLLGADISWKREDILSGLSYGFDFNANHAVNNGESWGCPQLATSQTTVAINAKPCTSGASRDLQNVKMVHLLSDLYPRPAEQHKPVFTAQAGDATDCTTFVSQAKGNNQGALDSKVRTNLRLPNKKLQLRQADSDFGGVDLHVDGNTSIPELKRADLSGSGNKASPKSSYDATSSTSISMRNRDRQRVSEPVSAAGDKQSVAHPKAETSFLTKKVGDSKHTASEEEHRRESSPSGTKAPLTEKPLAEGRDSISVFSLAKAAGLPHVVAAGCHALDKLAASALRGKATRTGGKMAAVTGVAGGKRGKTLSAETYVALTEAFVDMIQVFKDHVSLLSWCLDCLGSILPPSSSDRSAASDASSTSVSGSIAPLLSAKDVVKGTAGKGGKVDAASGSSKQQSSQTNIQSASQINQFVPEDQDPGSFKVALKSSPSGSYAAAAVSAGTSKNGGFTSSFCNGLASESAANSISALAAVAYAATVPMLAEKAVKAVLNAMQSCDIEAHSTQAALRALSAHLSSTNSKYVCDDAFAFIIAAMREFVSDAEMQAESCMALGSLTRAVSSATGHAAWAAITISMDHHRMNLMVQRAGCGALQVLCTRTGLGVPEWGTGKRPLRASRDADREVGVRALISAMSAFPEDVRIQWHGCSTLWTLVHSAGIRSVANMVRNGAVGAVVGAMSVCRMNEMIQQEGCNVLGTMARTLAENGHEVGPLILPSAVAELPSSASSPCADNSGKATRTSLESNKKAAGTGIGSRNERKNGAPTTPDEWWAALWAVVSAMKAFSKSKSLQSNGTFALGCILKGSGETFQTGMSTSGVSPSPGMPLSNSKPVETPHAVGNDSTPRPKLRFDGTSAGPLVPSTFPGKDVVADVERMNAAVEVTMAAMREFQKVETVQVWGCAVLQQAFLAYVHYARRLTPVSIGLEASLSAALSTSTGQPVVGALSRLSQSDAEVSVTVTGCSRKTSGLSQEFESTGSPPSANCSIVQNTNSSVDSASSLLKSLSPQLDAGMYSGSQDSCFDISVGDNSVGSLGTPQAETSSWSAILTVDSDSTKGVTSSDFCVQEQNSLEAQGCCESQSERDTIFESGCSNKSSAAGPSSTLLSTMASGIAQVSVSGNCLSSITENGVPPTKADAVCTQSPLTSGAVPSPSDALANLILSQATSAMCMISGTMALSYNGTSTTGTQAQSKASPALPKALSKSPTSKPMCTRSQNAALSHSFASVRQSWCAALGAIGDVFGHLTRNSEGSIGKSGSTGTDVLESFQSGKQFHHHGFMDSPREGLWNYRHKEPEGDDPQGLVEEDEASSLEALSVWTRSMALTGSQNCPTDVQAYMDKVVEGCKHNETVDSMDGAKSSGLASNQHSSWNAGGAKDSSGDSRDFFALDSTSQQQAAKEMKAWQEATESMAKIAERVGFPMSVKNAILAIRTVLYKLEDAETVIWACHALVSLYLTWENVHLFKPGIESDREEYKSRAWGEGEVGVLQLVDLVLHWSNQNRPDVTCLALQALYSACVFAATIREIEEVFCPGGCGAGAILGSMQKALSFGGSAHQRRKVVQQACCVLTTVCCYSIRAQLAIAIAGGADVILAALDKYDEDNQIQVDGLHALGLDSRLQPEFDALWNAAIYRNTPGVGGRWSRRRKSGSMIGALVVGLAHIYKEGVNLSSNPVSESDLPEIPRKEGMQGIWSPNLEKIMIDSGSQLGLFRAGLIASPGCGGPKFAIELLKRLLKVSGHRQSAVDMQAHICLLIGYMSEYDSTWCKELIEAGAMSAVLIVMESASGWKRQGLTNFGFMRDGVESEVDCSTSPLSSVDLDCQEQVLRSVAEWISGDGNLTGCHSDETGEFLCYLKEMVAMEAHKVNEGKRLFEEGWHPRIQRAACCAIAGLVKDVSFLTSALLVFTVKAIAAVLYRYGNLSSLNLSNERAEKVQSKVCAPARLALGRLGVFRIGTQEGDKHLAHDAAEAGDTLCLEALAGKGVDLLKTDQHGRTALWYAEKAGQAKAVQFLKDQAQFQGRRRAREKAKAKGARKTKSSVIVNHTPSVETEGSLERNAKVEAGAQGSNVGESVISSDSVMVQEHLTSSGISESAKEQACTNENDGSDMTTTLRSDSTIHGNFVVECQPDSIAIEVDDRIQKIEALGEHGATESELPHTVEMPEATLSDKPLDVTISCGISAIGTQVVMASSSDNTEEKEIVVSPETRALEDETNALNHWLREAMSSGDVEKMQSALQACSASQCTTDDTLLKKVKAALTKRLKRMERGAVLQEQLICAIAEGESSRLLAAIEALETVPRFASAYEGELVKARKLLLDMDVQEQTESEDVHASSECSSKLGDAMSVQLEERTEEMDDTLDVASGWAFLEESENIVRVEGITDQLDDSDALDQANWTNVSTKGKRRKDKVTSEAIKRQVQSGPSVLHSKPRREKSKRDRRPRGTFSRQQVSYLVSGSNPAFRMVKSSDTDLYYPNDGQAPSLSGPMDMPPLLPTPFKSQLPVGPPLRSVIMPPRSAGRPCATHDPITPQLFPESRASNLSYARESVLDYALPVTPVECGGPLPAALRYASSWASPKLPNYRDGFVKDGWSVDVPDQDGSTSHTSRSLADLLATFFPSNISASSSSTLFSASFGEFPTSPGPVDLSSKHLEHVQPLMPASTPAPPTHAPVLNVHARPFLPASSGRQSSFLSVEDHHSVPLDSAGTTGGVIASDLSDCQNLSQSVAHSSFMQPDFFAENWQSDAYRPDAFQTDADCGDATHALYPANLDDKTPAEVALLAASMEESCCICFDLPKDAAFIPCGHRMCKGCAEEMHRIRHQCPICNRSIDAVLALYGGNGEETHYHS